MAKDIRALVVKVLKGGIIVAVIGLVLGIAGVASGSAAILEDAMRQIQKFMNGEKEK